MQSFIPDSMRLLVVGINHRTAPVALRERLAFSPEQLSTALKNFQLKFPGAEVVILSTCNRVEAYIARPLRSEPTPESLAHFLADFHAVPQAEVAPHVYHHEDRAVVEHLFAVASSLDSMVVGETQILSQVKQAYQAACDASTSGKIFHALFQRALGAAKDVHQRTGLSSGRLSIASVAVELVQSVFDRFNDKTVLCVGAGKMAGMMLRHLRELSPKKVIIANRSPGRAEEMATEFGGHVALLEGLSDLLVEADIVLTSTGASEPIIRDADFAGIIKRRRYRPLVMVDIAVPRDVESAVGRHQNVYLYNVDDLQEVAAGNKAKRDQAIQAARDVLREAVEEFLKWFAARDIGPLVKALYEQCHAYAEAELKETLARNPQMMPEQRAELERMTHRLVGKILHGPVTELTTRAENTARPMLAGALRKLFNLANELPPDAQQK